MQIKMGSGLVVDVQYWSGRRYCSVWASCFIAI